MKYKTAVFDKRIAYSSHPGLSLEEQSAIESGNFNNIPSVYEGIEVLDIDGCFIPEVSEGEWQLRSSGWYVNSDGVKIKKFESCSPDFKKSNGHGACDIRIIIKIPVG